MKYRYLAAMVAATFILVAAVSGQDKAANFSGTWQLDVAKSKLGERSMIESQTLTVTQTDKDLTVKTATTRTPPPADAAENTRGGGRMGGGRGFGGDSTVTYNLDGKETKTEVEGRMGKMPVTLKAKVEGSKLQLSSSSSFSGPMGDVTITTKEKWDLSADGKTLTVNTDRSTPRGSESTTRVFNKIS